MDLPLLTIIIILVIIFFFLILTTRLSNRSEKYSEYRRIETLFSPAERSFLGVLESSIPEGMRIFGKVRVADVLTPSSSANKSHWQTAFNKISAKHFDYVLCDSSTLKVIAVIELDDKSHNSKKAKARDIFLNDICQGAKLPIIRFSAKHSYTVDIVKESIFNSLPTHYPEIENTGEIVAESMKDGSEIVHNSTKQELISSSKIAKRLNLSTNDFMAALLKCGYIEERENTFFLTELGQLIGGEHVQKSKFSPYFKWPSNFDSSLLKTLEAEDKGLLKG